MSSENLQVFFQSAYELSMANGQHAFFLVHTHHQPNPNVFADLIGQGNDTSQEMLATLESTFILVAETFQHPAPTVTSQVNQTDMQVSQNKRLFYLSISQ